MTQIVLDPRLLPFADFLLGPMPGDILADDMSFQELIEYESPFLLDESFYWKKTPQGHAYWMYRNNETVEMTAEDWLFVIALYDIAVEGRKPTFREIDVKQIEESLWI